MQYTENGKTAKASESVEDFTGTNRRVPKKQSQKKKNTQKRLMTGAQVSLYILSSYNL